jgi:hypothetical protein
MDVHLKKDHPKSNRDGRAEELDTIVTERAKKITIKTKTDPPSISFMQRRREEMTRE